MRVAGEGVSATPLVLGGGPAGSMFALTVARAGRDVTLLEKTTGAHDKVCGEFLSRESLLYLQRHGLHPRTLGGAPIRTVRLVTPWFTRASALPFEAWSLTRRRLDDALLHEAARQGAQVRRGAHVVSLSESGGAWSTHLREGDALKAHDVVLATGKLDVKGWPRPQGRQGDLVAFKMYYRLTDEQAARLRNELLQKPCSTLFKL